MNRSSGPPPSHPESLARALADGTEDDRVLGLFLDYDGTLVEIRPTPAEARADDELLDLLRDLAAAPRVRLAVATGRTLESLAQVLPPVPGLLRFGEHGASGQDENGVFNLVEAGRNVAPIPDPLIRALAGGPWPEGVRVERKSWSVAVHTRNAPETSRTAAAARLRSLVEEDGEVEILTGKELWEVRPRGVHKGLALERFRSGLPSGRRRVACLGDDRTDEDAFRTLGPGDVGILVAADPRPSAAGHRLSSVREVRACLAELRRLLAVRERA